MKNLRFITLALVIVSFAMVDLNFLYAKESLLVDCAFASVKDEYKHSKAVFVGKLVNTTENADAKTFEFRVERFWKGAKGKKIKIVVSKTMRFEPFYEAGKSYLIYAFTDEKGVLHTAKCTRGFRIEFAKEDLKILGKAKISR